MPKFFFNSEALLPSDNIHEFLSFFVTTLLAYDELCDDKKRIESNPPKRKLNIENGIITENQPSKISLGNFMLSDVINQIEDKSQRRLAFKYFTKSPIENYLTIANEAILEKGYTIELEVETESKKTKIIQKDTLSLAYIANANEFAFTVGTHKDLRHDILTLKPNDESENLSIKNLYGAPDNTKFIENKLTEIQNTKLSNLERLKAILGNSILSSLFEREFGKLTLEQQVSIIERLSEAIDRNLLSRFYPDTNIIKDVTPQYKPHNVYELRVRTPLEIRVYLHETEEEVIIASVQKKSNPNQNKDITQAYNIINNIIKTQK